VGGRRRRQRAYHLLRGVVVELGGEEGALVPVGADHNGNSVEFASLVKMVRAA
jgi:hypothetical protein